MSRRIPFAGSFPYTDDTRSISRVYNANTPETDQSQIVVDLEKFDSSVTVLIGLFDDGVTFLLLVSNREVGRLMLCDGLKSKTLKYQSLTDSLLCRLAGTEPAVETGINYQSFSLRLKTNMVQWNPMHPIHMTRHTCLRAPLWRPAKSTLSVAKWRKRRRV